MAAQAASTTRSAWRTAFIAGAIALSIALFDPFGLDQASDDRSADAINRVAALFYPDKYGRDALTTVAIDEAALASAGRDWPPQFDFYADVLDVVTSDRRTRPAAVFLDFTFVSELYSEARRDRFVAKVHEVTNAAAWTTHEECHRTPLAKIGCILAKGGVPVIIGKPYPADRCDLSLTVQLLDRAAVLVPLGWPDMNDHWRASISKASYQAQRPPDAPPCRALEGVGGHSGYATLDYVSTAEGVTWRLVPRGVPVYDLTPSAALFAAICLQRPSASPHCGKGDDRALETFLRQEVPLKILWPSIPNPAFMNYEAKVYQSQADDDRHKVCLREARNLGRLLYVAAREFTAGLNTDAAPTRVDCPYHADIRYDHLTDPQLASRIRPEFIKGRAVLIGAALSQSNDWVSSITRGKTPGVVLHAMALDNLLELGPGMQRSPQRLGETPLDAGELVEVALAFAAAFLLSLAAAHAPTLPPDHPGHVAARRRRLLLAALAVSLSLVVFIAAAMILLLAFHWEPVNVVGLWLLTVALATITFHESLTEAGRMFARDVALGLEKFRTPKPKPFPQPTAPADSEDAA